MAFAIPVHIHMEHAPIPSIPISQDDLVVSSLIHPFILEWLQQQASLVSLVPPAYAAEPPSNSDVALLNRAMAAYSKNDDTATDLLTQTIAVWKDQPPDEQAALYLLRANSYMATSTTTAASAASAAAAAQQAQDAIQDYTRAIPNLQSNDLPSAYLGRARAFRSLSLSNPSNAADAAAAAAHACDDYRMSFQLSSRDRDDNDDYNDDGTSNAADSPSSSLLTSLYARINPYAAWEWGSSLLTCGQYNDAAHLHTAASRAFDDVGDHGRAVISLLDAGIDMAALVASIPSSSSSASSLDDAKKLLIKAIDQTTTVQGRDVALLQRVIAKEGEARIALASILWSSSAQSSPSSPSPIGSTGSNKQEAEGQLGQACLRLEQLDQDAMERNAKQAVVPGLTVATNPKYSIDDQAGALDVSCSRFKSDKFLTDTLQWPAPLQDKVRKLIMLQ